MNRIFNIPSTLPGLRAQLASLPDGLHVLAKPTHWDKICWLLDKLANQHHYDKRANKDDYRNLNAELLYELMGKRYAQMILAVLQDNDIIEQNGSYQANGFSIGYRLTEPHRSARRVCVFNADSKFVAKLERVDKKGEGQLYLEQTLRSSVGIRYADLLRDTLGDIGATLLATTSYVGTNRIDLHAEGALEAWTEHQRDLNTWLDWDSDEKTDRLRQHLQAAGRIFTGALFSVLGKRGQRLHTNITNLWGPFRKYLTLDGHHDLMNTDIPASQLVFACVPLLHYYREQNMGAVPADVARWVQLCTSEDPYELLHLGLQQLTFDEAAEQTVQAQSGDFAGARYLYRQQFKATFFARIYYSELLYNQGERMNRESAWMHDNFPHVMAWIVEQKQGDYADFSINMQRAESNFIIKLFGAQAKTWQLPVVTIHDSALVPAQYSRQVLDYFQAYFDQALRNTGSKVKMKAESLTDKAAKIHQAQYELF